MNLETLETRKAPGRKLYTGIAPIKIVAVNPTQQELSVILDKSIDDVKEPNYFLENATRLDFWYKNHETLSTSLLGKFSLFVSDEVRVSQSGKFMFMDAHTNTCWVNSQAEIKDFNGKREHSQVDHVTARKTYKGEDEVYSLLKAYANVDTRKNPFVLDNFLAIVKNNVKELSDYFTHFNDNPQGGVKVLFGVKDGQYQDIWDKVFLPLNGKITDYNSRKIKDESYGYRHFYNNSFDFQEFDSSVTTQASEESVEWASPVAVDVFGGESIADPFEDAKPASTPSSTNELFDF